MDSKGRNVIVCDNGTGVRIQFIHSFFFFALFGKRCFLAKCEEKEKKMGASRYVICG